MSICRFGPDSNVYVYEVDNGYDCCGCPAFNGITQTFPNAERILQHLMIHQTAMDLVPAHAIARLAAKSERERIIKLLLSADGYQWLSRWTLIGDESDLVAYINGDNE